MENNNIKSHSVLLYNTQNIDAQLLKAGFSIRKKEYQRIWKDIQTSKMTHPETHYLIQGVRGAGKTTLLSRLSYEVAEDKKLSEWLIPILLNEEEYGILSLFTFWLRIAEKLAEYDAQLYSELFQQVLSLDDDAVVAWELIQHYLDKSKQKIIVFVDNLGELFKDFDKVEHAQLREVLSLHPHIRLIGGSSQSLEAHFDVSAPFYQFFKLINLKSIDETEMHELLRSLATQTGEEAVKTIEEIITEYPERIEAVRRLTDGVPRTIVLLFQIIMEGAKESSYAYLEETIDKTTPLYKHRMDDLSRQQKAIVHVIAMNWDAMSTKEIAEQTRLPSKTVSAQLVKLQQQWIVDKIETNTKNHLYIIKERFFNIWYLMRYGNQTDKRRVLWLTRFLESWHSKEELNFKLIDLAIPYMDINEGEGYTLAKPKEIYVNALLASKFIDESFKESVNTVLKPYYNNLIENKHKEVFSKNLIDLLNKLDEDDYITTKKSLENLLELNVGIANYLNCLEMIFRYSDNQNLKEIVMDKVWNKSIENGTSYVALILKIMNSNYQSFNELGRFITEKLKIKEVRKEGVGLFIFTTHIKLWFDDFEGFNKNIRMLKKTKFNIDYNPIDSVFLEKLLLLLIKKDQLEIVYGLMNEFSHLKEQFKPMYYAVVFLLKDERHQEYLRMGSELQGTVDEILQKVEEFRVKYA